MKWKLTYSVLIIVLFWGCKSENMGDCFKGTGKEVEVVREIPPGIQRIILKDNVHLVITQDSVESLKLTGGANVLKLVKTIVNGNELEIRNDNTCNFVRSYRKDIIAFLHIKDPQYLRYEGAGKVTTTNMINTTTFTCDMWDGSRDLRLCLDVDTINCFNHVGPGDVKMHGTAKYARLYSDGNGFMEADSLDVDIVNIDWRGTGNCTVATDSILEVTIHYIGDVYYKGDPKITSNLLHDGKLIKF